MGILNIDEHVEEHRLMAIRYPSKAVIPGTNVIAASNIPFLIMPGDGAANGCQFTGTNGAFTLSAAIIANIGASLAGCYAYFSANFGGSSLPAGWYWTEFSSDTAGIVYAENYTSGKVSRPETKTAITPNLSGWVTGTTSEITGPTGFILPGTALGKNGRLVLAAHPSGSTSSTKTFRVRDVASTTQFFNFGTTTLPVSEILSEMVCFDSHTVKAYHRGFGLGAATNYATPITVDSSVDRTLQVTLQQAANTAAPILVSFSLTATYGE